MNKLFDYSGTRKFRKTFAPSARLQSATILSHYFRALKYVRENKLTVTFVLLVLAWLLVRHSVTSWICQGSNACWLYPDSWPALLGETASSSAWLVGLLAGVLFALPVGRSGLVATLVGIKFSGQFFGFFGTFAIFLASSAISIVVTHAFVEFGLQHPRSAWVHVRLKPIRDIFGSAVRKNGLLWLSVGNLVGSQWHMSALGILSGIRRETIWFGLLLGNLAGFALVYWFSQVPNLDAVSIVLLVLAVALAVSSPVLWAGLKHAGSSGKKKQ